MDPSIIISYTFSMLSRFKRKWRKHSDSQDFKPVILITGCSSGIGLALAKLFHSLEQYRIVVTSRPSSIQALKDHGFSDSDRFWVRPLDVKSHANQEQLVSEIGKHWDGVDILINNAGISYRSVVEHMDEASELNQMDTNYLGPIGLIRKCIPQMRQKGRGKIINVSSVSGMLAMPTMASYSASKHALEGASEALWYEMKPLGINVTLIQPGFIKSDSFKNVYFSEKAKKATQEDLPYSDYYKHMGPFVMSLMNRSLSTPERIAKRVLWVVKKQSPPLRIAGTIDAEFFYYIRRFLPRRFLHKFLFWCLPKTQIWAKNYTQSRNRKKEQ